VESRIIALFRHIFCKFWKSSDVFQLDMETSISC
jgi:hypothetical protein